MTKNDSYIVVHNYIDSLQNVKFITMISCIVLVIILVVVLMIILAVVIFLLLRKYKIEPQRISNPLRSSCETLRENSIHSVPAGCSRRNPPCTSAINPAAILDDEMDINSNVQNIAMASVKSRLENPRECSPQSSDLGSILFPPEHDGEIIHESPVKLKAFAGRVFASTRRKSIVSRAESKVSKPETPRERKHSNPETHNSSLEWDYFESRLLGASNASDRSEIVEENTINISWV